MTLSDWVIVIGIFLWNHAAWIWCSIGFVMLCQAISHIGNVPRQICPRPGCALRERLDAATPIPIPICLLCEREEQRSQAYACEHCGNARQGTPRHSLLCRPCWEAEQEDD